MRCNTNEPIQLIENNDGAPFYLNLWFYTVHTPIQAKIEHIKKLETKVQEMGLDQTEPFEIGEPFPSEHKKHLNVTRWKVQSDPVYAAMIYALDENIGHLLDALERTGQADNDERRLYLLLEAASRSFGWGFQRRDASWLPEPHSGIGA